MEEQATILAVDDTEDNLDLLEFALKRKPVRMLRAMSGLECLAVAELEQPDIILLDIQMPGMDGFETLKELRSRRLTASIPVIVLTAQKKDPGSIEQGLLLGADEYLTKPIDIDELLVRMRTLIRLKKAEFALEKMKADFMAMLVHDLRAPMTGIKGVLDFMQDMILEQKAMSNEHSMLVASAQMSLTKTLDLINELLDFSRYGAGQINLERRPVEIPQLTESVLQQLNLQFRNKRINIQRHLPAQIPNVNVDPGKISQVLMNLFSNAYKFTNPGGEVIVSANTVQVDSKSLMEFAISNTGAGIKEEELPYIFQLYRQGSSARRAKEQGSGLGLAICKMIVEAHGGEITVKSIPGAMTTFRFTVPIN